MLCLCNMFVCVSCVFFVVFAVCLMYWLTSFCLLCVIWLFPLHAVLYCLFIMCGVASVFVLRWLYQFVGPVCIVFAVLHCFMCCCGCFVCCCFCCVTLLLLCVVFG